MQLLSRSPTDPRLAPFVQTLWYCERPPEAGRERVLPSGVVQLIVDLATKEEPHAFVVGPQTRASLIDVAAMRRSAGIAFHIGGAWALLGHPCRLIQDDTVEVAALWGDVSSRDWHDVAEAPDGATVLVRLETLIARRLNGAGARDPAIDDAVNGLAHGATVADTIDRLGLARATFIRRFERTVGLSPKLWAGLARFQRATGLIARNNAPLADVALACGYADQAHMTRAFRRFAGLTPTGYRPRSAEEPNHVPA